MLGDRARRSSVSAVTTAPGEAPSSRTAASRPPASAATSSSGPSGRGVCSASQAPQRTRAPSPCGRNFRKSAVLPIPASPANRMSLPPGPARAASTPLLSASSSAERSSKAVVSPLIGQISHRWAHPREGRDLAREGLAHPECARTSLTPHRAAALGLATSSPRRRGLAGPIAQAVERDVEDVLDLFRRGCRVLPDAAHDLQDVVEVGVGAHGAGLLGALQQRLAGREEGSAAAAKHLCVAVEVVPELLGESVLAADVGDDAVQPPGKRLPRRQVGQLAGRLADLLDLLD